MGEAAVKITETAEGAVAAPKKKVISTATWIAGGIMGMLLLGLGILDYLKYAGPLAAQTMPITIAINIMPLFVGIIMLVVAMSFGKGGTIRLTWSLFAAAYISIAIGSIIWTVLYSQLGHDPWPSVADIFYTLLYPLEFAALLLAARSYRTIASFRTPLIVSAVVGVVAAVVVYFTVLAPFVFAAAGSLPPVGLALSVFNPLADCFLLLAPAVMLGMLLRRLGTGRIAWPWYIVVASMMATGVADSYYSYIKFAGQTNMLVTDMGWLACELLLLLAAFVARDVYRS
jgi:hypothetical protein